MEILVRKKKIGGKTGAERPAETTAETAKYAANYPVSLEWGFVFTAQAHTALNGRNTSPSHGWNKILLE